MVVDKGIKDLQHFFQAKHVHTYLKGNADRVISVAVPIGFVAVGGFMLMGGLANLYRGTGKRDQ